MAASGGRIPSFVRIFEDSAGKSRQECLKGDGERRFGFPRDFTSGWKCDDGDRPIKAESRAIWHRHLYPQLFGSRKGTAFVLTQGVPSGFDTRGQLEGRCPGFRDGVVLVSGSAAYADRADDLAVLFQRNSAREDHDFSVVRGVNSKELISGLRMGAVFVGNVECTGGVRLLMEISMLPSHAPSMRTWDTVTSFIRHRDVHWLPDLDRLLLRAAITRRASSSFTMGLAP